MSFDFGRIIGGIMTAVIEGRSMADRKSMEIAMQYGEHDMMRLFPVPRMDINNVEVDFKFVLDEHEFETVHSPEADDLIQNTALSARDAVMNNLASLYKFLSFPSVPDKDMLGAMVETKVSQTINQPTQLAVSTSAKPGVALQTFDLNKVAQRILTGWQDAKLLLSSPQTQSAGPTAPATGGTAGADDSPKGFFQKLKQMGNPSNNNDETPDLRSTDSGKSQPASNQAAIDALAELLKPVKTEHEAQVKMLQENAVEHSHFPMKVKMKHQDLADMPEDIMSNIKISINVSNYEWVKVDEQDGSPLHRLMKA